MPTSKGEDPPASAVRGITFPIEWRPPPLFPHRFPALGKPKLGARVSVVGHELQILTTRDAAVCDPKGFQVHLVAGSFVIEAKIEAVRRVYRITNFSHTVMEAMPLEARMVKPRVLPLKGLASYAGRSGFEKKACLISVSINSWCCCSWFRPNMMRRAASS